MSGIVIYLLIINSFAFLLFLYDKLMAIYKKQRISEMFLLFVSFIGGSLGSILGMIICRHKIRKVKFYLLIPLMLSGHIYLLLF